MDTYPLEGLVAYQIAVDLKIQIGTLLERTPAGRDLRFNGQIRGASESLVSNIAEGHRRYNPAEFANFLRYSRASIGELQERLPDGISRKFYAANDIASIMELLEREAVVVGRLRDSMFRLAKRRKSERQRKGRSR
ncbi:MAG: four helix bundle protein [Vicinamibacterales bacterium]